MAESARISYNAWVRVWITPEDIQDMDEYQGFLAGSVSRDDMLRTAAMNKLLQAESSGIKIEANDFTIDSDSIDWDALLHPSSEREATLKAKGANPAQQSANDALKVAKALESLKNLLARIQGREEIAQVTGLSDIADAIDRAYELAERYRTGGIQQITPQQPGVPQPEAAIGWDPEKLISVGKSFIDDKKQPIETVVDPAEEYRHDREREVCPHCGPTALRAVLKVKPKV